MVCLRERSRGPYVPPLGTIGGQPPAPTDSVVRPTLKSRPYRRCHRSLYRAPPLPRNCSLLLLQKSAWRREMIAPTSRVSASQRCTRSRPWSLCNQLHRSIQQRSCRRLKRGVPHPSPRSQAMTAAASATLSGQRGPPRTRHHVVMPMHAYAGHQPVSPITLVRLLRMAAPSWAPGRHSCAGKGTQATM